MCLCHFETNISYATVETVLIIVVNSLMDLVLRIKEEVFSTFKLNVL